jgi:hypothetical protein
MDKQCGEKTHDDKENVFNPNDRSMMIDLNNIAYVLKGDNATVNIANIFLERTSLQIPDDTWIAYVSFMNMLWSVQLGQWAHRIHKFFEWLD